MDEWNIKEDFLSKLYMKMIKTPPFSKIKRNKELLESFYLENFRYKNLPMQNKDYLIPRIVCVTQIIPIKEFQLFFNSFNTFINCKCKKEAFPNQENPISFFNEVSIFDGAWHRLGHAELLNCNILNKLSAFAYRLTDSFIQVTFYCEISRTFCSEFEDIVRRHYELKILLTTRKHPLIFRNQAMRIYSPIHSLKSAIFNFFSSQKTKIINLFQKNNLIFHIGDANNMHFLNVLSFKKCKNKMNSSKISFWNTIDLDNHNCYINQDNTLFFPESLNFQNDIGTLSNYLLINDDNYKLNLGYVTIDDQIRIELNNFGMNIIRAFAIQKVFKDSYIKISNFRINYFNSKNNFIFLYKYQLFQSTNYWISLLSKEYFDLIKTQNISQTLTLLRNNEFSLIDLLDKQNDLQINAIDALSKFIDQNITKFNEYKLLVTNTITQVIILLLTIITAIMGILQINQ